METSSIARHIPLHANLKRVLFELINIIEPVTSWLNGQRLFFFLISPYCPDYCRWYVIPSYNNTDIFVHCKRWSDPKMYRWIYNIHCLIEPQYTKHKNETNV